MSVYQVLFLNITVDVIPKVFFPLLRLGIFEKFSFGHIRKASFVTSACLTTRIEQIGFHWKNFHES